MMPFYFPTLKDVAHKHYPPARSWEKTLSVFKMLQFQDAQDSNKNQRPKTGITETTQTSPKMILTL